MGATVKKIVAGKKARKESEWVAEGGGDSEEGLLGITILNFGNEIEYTKGKAITK